MNQRFIILVCQRTRVIGAMASNVVFSSIYAYWCSNHRKLRAQTIHQSIWYASISPNSNFCSRFVFRWNKLIMYNVGVIFVKMSLQVVGCVYMSQMYKHHCWVLQLFGIACLKTGIKPEMGVFLHRLGATNFQCMECDWTILIDCDDRLMKTVRVRRLNAENLLYVFASTIVNQRANLNFIRLVDHNCCFHWR